jgi:hypothetical protein
VYDITWLFCVFDGSFIVLKAAPQGDMFGPILHIAIIELEVAALYSVVRCS